MSTIALIAAALFLCSLSVLSAQPGALRSGPMVGYVEMRQALLWVQTGRAARVRFVYREKGASLARTTGEVMTRAEDAFVAKLIADSLEPGRRYLYELYLDGRPVQLSWPLEFSTPRGRVADDSSSFTVAVGSCAYIAEVPAADPRGSYRGDYRIFTSIAARRPDLMLWIGDNIYLAEEDWSTREGFRHRYTHGRALPQMQPLLGSAANYAIWDDHDYGFNDADRSFRSKDISRETFGLFWGNPPDGAAETSGINTSFVWNDAEFFLLDNRTWRSPNRAKSGTREMLGERQIRWLVDRLTTSTAAFKIIVVGGQTLNPAAVFENYATYPDERARLLELIAKEEIPGVFFLSGDRHHGELTMMPRPGDYPLYDLTVSPLTANPYLDTAEANTLRVPGTDIGVHNFATLEFSGAGAERGITIRMFDADGREIWNRKIGTRELRAKR